MHTQQHPPYIHVYKSIGGWKACLMTWTQYDKDYGFYEPYQTGYGFELKEEAVADAKDWAKSSGISYEET
jgi:hypothetical protein